MISVLKKHIALILFALVFLAVGYFIFSKTDAALGSRQLGRNASGAATSSLVAHWTFNEGTSTTAGDFSGNGNNGTFVNDLTWVDGKRGKALDFAGSNDYVDLGTTQFLATGTPFTIAAWVRLEQYGGTFKFPTIFASKTNVSGQTWRIAFSDDTGGFTGSDITFGAGGSEWADLRIPSIGTYLNTWIHVVVTYNGTGAGTQGNYAAYIDGASKSIGSASAFSTLSDNSQIGSVRPGTSNHDFDGQIDDLRVYSRALSAAEATALFNEGSVEFKSANNSGLVGHWPMNEGSGTEARDFSGRNHPGTLTNGPAWVDGLKGKVFAVDFDGSNDYINIPNHADFQLSSFTISVWFKADTLPNSFPAIITKDGSPSNRNYAIYINDSTDRINVSSSFGGTEISLDTGVNALDGKWHHVVYIANSSEQVGYVDGVLRTSATRTVAPDSGNSSPVRISGFSVGDLLFDGQIDDVRIYNRRLTEEEIKGLHSVGVNLSASQNSKLTSGLVGLWSFNGPDVSFTQNKAFDRSSNANHGTLTNMATATAPVPGRVGQGLKFDGVNDYVDVTSSTLERLPATSNTTVSMWVNPDSLAGGPAGLSALFAAAYLDHSHGRWGLLMTNDGKVHVRAYASNIATYREAVSSTAMTTHGGWYHVVGVYDRTNQLIRVYMNGTEESTGTFLNTDTLEPSSGEPDTIGANKATTDNPSFFNGQIDEFRVYNRALSAAEIKRLYLMGK